LPFVVKVLEEPPRLEPDFATSFNLEADDPAELMGTAGVSDGEEVSDRDDAWAAFFAPRNVLLTDTDLKLWGFLTVEEARAWPNDDLSLDVDASVSDPPLTLTSAELTSSSTISAICLFLSMSSGRPPPFSGTAEWSTWWGEVSVVAEVGACWGERERRVWSVSAMRAVTRGGEQCASEAEGEGCKEQKEKG
jgi:hypothetical protein